VTRRVRVFDHWQLDVDRRATVRAYRGIPPWGGIADSDSPVCLNFRLAYLQMPAGFLAALDSLGINPTQPAEVYDVGPVEGGERPYGGWYHVVGKLLGGTDTLRPEGPGRWHMVYREIAPGFSVGVTARLPALPPGFPSPALQVEFWGQLPWLVEE